jgi:hypothetical protein
MPAPVSARTRFIAAPAFAYARIMRPGSGTRSSGLATSELMMSPRYTGRPSASVVPDRGLAYCPAMRATLTTGRLAP